MAEGGFWDDQESAQKVVAELKVARAVVDPCDEAAATLEEIETLVELGEEAGA
ncbi:MAG: peptide chain release factor 2, partial [Planctomycetota bacterium]